MLCTKDHEFEYEEQCPCYDIPIFHNLTHLELHDTLELVPQKLQHFPNLQILELHEASFEMRGSEEDILHNWVEPEVVPQCLSSYLRICTIHNFLGLQKLALENKMLWNKQPRLEMKQPPQPKPDQRSSFSMKPKRTEPPGKGINPPNTATVTAAIHLQS
ncbi:hypothetical protein P8452_60440 [Trifolium repens]|nr:hypothetical protein P8452_60440 [Trifolium repens]